MDEHPWLPWSKPLRRRCRARLLRTDARDYYGRCELIADHHPLDHALERGMLTVRWRVETRVE